MKYWHVSYVYSQNGYALTWGSTTIGYDKQWFPLRDCQKNIQERHSDGNPVVIINFIEINEAQFNEFNGGDNA